MLHVTVKVFAGWSDKRLKLLDGPHMSFVDGSVEANLSLCGLVIHENALAVWKCFSLKQLQSLISHCHLNCQTYGEKHDTEAHIHSEKITNSGISPLVASLQ